MYGTLQTLVDMLESSDADGGASGGETEETIDKIMSLVNKMVDEDESGDVSGMPEPPARSTPGSGRKSDRKKSPKKSPRTELPHYPTPYELWKKSHETVHVETPKERVAKLSKAERAELAKKVTDRLLRRQREEHFSMMKKQHKKLADELRGLTFVPNLSRTEKMNKKLVQSYEPLYKRYNYVTEMSNIKRTKMEQETRTAELAECSFEPDRSMTRGKVTPRTDMGSTVYDRCMKFGEEKELWSQQRREIIKRIESEALTFSPKISDKTTQIIEEKKMNGSYVPPHKRPTSARKKNMKLGHENDTFSPAINHRSERKTFKTSVYDRLYAKAKKLNEKRRKEQTKIYEKYVRNVPTPLTLARNAELPEEYQNMDLDDEEKRELALRIKQLSDSPKMFCPRQWVNKVEWNPKYSFIASQFPAKAT